ncbi:hypothetical protein [Flavobacterium sp.]|uniref:hypothetical protein n=1 Tax=Flavobacterium sp. TaxID=239 RepID=UPI002627908A|nr:hypothetical protein [Flavobacterium sp.]
MKVGTINIDWFLKNETTKKLIIERICQQDFDFLIVTENIEDFTFSEKYFVYHSDRIPLNTTYENLDYGFYLKGKQAIRTSIYSKYPSIKKNKVEDSFTSICHTFLVDGKSITIYGTIIGTWGILHQKTLAKKELLNFIKDSEGFHQYENMIVAGDFNTSFIVSENREMAQINSRAIIKLQADRIGMTIPTEKINNNIDAILISRNLQPKEISVFITEEELKDKFHKGIFLEIN